MSGRRQKGDAGVLRVHHFASLASGDNLQALTAELKVLLERKTVPRRAWVNLWEVRSSHQYLLLPSGRASDLESAARHHGASALGLSDPEVTVAARVGSARGDPGHHSKTEVSFFAAGTQEVRDRLRPLVDAGFEVEGVTTPCGALWSQARLRRPSLPGEVHAHVALGVAQSALGIFSNGSLLYARDLEWGYAEQALGVPVPLNREDLAGRLAAELRRSFLYLKQYWEEEVSQVLLCGDMPEIRSLTAPLIERLNIEVETLDTLEGIETVSVPAGFADSAATYRLACSIAADPPPVNLLPVEITAGRTSRTGRRIFVAGTAAAVAFGAFLYAQASVARAEADRQWMLVQRELSQLQPAVAALAAAQARPEMETAQRAALSALDAQGPSMARLLEMLANAAPDDVTLTSVRALPDRDAWSVTVEAFSNGPDVVRARNASESFLRTLEDSPFFGTPLQPPTRRIVGGSRRGIELAARYRVRK
jgi:Tfp pilus assembly protein PilN/Tfp pilus assembly PilM family ATPase